MNPSDQSTLTRQSLDKMVAAIALVRASLDKLPPYDDRRVYDADEREPFDALSDRFIRAVEVCLRFFRSYERLQFAEESDTLRDLLNRMEKMGMVSSVEAWFRMRDVRNRIVHDYLPGVVKHMYDDIMGDFGKELAVCAANAQRRWIAPDSKQ